MIQDELTYRILQEFHFKPTADQLHALRTFSEFLYDRDPHAVMILRGSAGTGKTSLAGSIVRTMNLLKHKIVLMAPTGRAAKVFSFNSGYQAFTIHRKIYRERTFDGPNGQFNLNDNLHADTLFMIDEASMVSNQGFSMSSFGSGHLLDDLIKFVYQGRNCRALFIGDTAQLPPVGEIESPALQTAVLEGYGLKTFECDLHEVLRQSHGSGILWNATMIRQMITHDEATELPKMRFRGFADISIVPGNELIESLASSYYKAGVDDTIVITRANKRANIYNQGIRNTVLDRTDELCSGDQLMIVKNKYLNASLKAPVSFIANGDMAKVLRVRNIHELYGFRFADVLLSFMDYDNFELETTVVLDTLTSDAPALTREQNQLLYESVVGDYADVPLKKDRMKQVREDKYYNAMQIKFGYAVTCHKAQGGQWTDVYVDQGYMTDDMLTPDYIHWLYTAFTRATEHLYLVNWSKAQTEPESIEDF